MLVSPLALPVGVGEAPRHEVAGGGAVAVQKYHEFLDELYQIAPDAVVAEEEDGQLVILTGLTLNRSPDKPGDIEDFFVHSIDLLSSAR